MKTLEIRLSDDEISRLEALAREKGSSIDGVVQAIVAETLERERPVPASSSTTAPRIEFAGAIDRRIYARALRLSGAPVWLGVILLAAGAYGLTTIRDFSQPGAWAMPLFVLLFGLMTVLTPFRIARNVVRPGSIIAAPFSGHVDDEHFVMETANGRTNIAWSSFHRAVIATDLLLLFQSPQVFNMMSRSFFRTEGDWTAFQTIVRRSVPLKNLARSIQAIALIAAVLVIVGFLLWTLWSR